LKHWQKLGHKLFINNIKELRKMDMTAYFIEFYMAALRAARGNKFLRSPKPDGERWKDLDKARQIVDDLEGDYSDYINVQFSAFRKLGFPPQPHQLLTDKAIMRYKTFQRMKNKFRTPDYKVDGNIFIVNETGKEYNISQANLGSSNDPIALYTFSLSSDPTQLDDLNVKGLKEAFEGVAYTICKLKYKSKMVGDRLLRLYKDLKERTQGGTNVTQTAYN
jgi:hypothetical protein